MAKFRRGISGVSFSDTTAAFEPVMLPDSEKERMCRELLSEFGVTSIKTTHTGEMIHSCPLPNSGHKNGDASASASLNYKKLVFKCLGCGSSGGLLWFIAMCRGESSDDSRRWLEDKTGSGPDEQPLSALLEFFDAVYNAPKRIAPEPIPKMSEEILTPWLQIHPYLTDPIATGGRGIPVSTVMSFKVGYASKYRMTISDNSDPEGKRRKEILSQRIVIPHFWKGNLVGWQTRRLVKDGTAKYISSPSFPKDSTLFNYNSKSRSVVLVESPMSVLSKWHVVPQMMATFGASVTDRQLRSVSMIPRVILWMDPDAAGYTATRTCGDFLGDYCDVWVVDSPWDADPADLPDEEVERLLNGSLTPYSLWGEPKILLCWECKGETHDGPCK